MSLEWTTDEVQASSFGRGALQNYTLGDCLGRGAFGAVYRALNWDTGETVAVKQIKLSDIPKAELQVIMTEIDLLKNLNHSNIVKYQGFVKTNDSLNIILEFCENGSLHSICKNFGKFPENLVALYITQVLHGLLYLHDQGVIHRDIKGANILTTKDGLVKLADFGVATRTTTLSDYAVVGSPYWMAPEVIELSGATTASDIWSVGCTVIELLQGRPPYHNLDPMPALFRIVKDDYPPLPNQASPALRDFLMQCFQKDPNLRISAGKLLRHPWLGNVKIAGRESATKFDDAIRSVQEWNEALRSPSDASLRRREGPNPPNIENGLNGTLPPLLNPSRHLNLPAKLKSVKRSRQTKGLDSVKVKPHDSGFLSTGHSDWENDFDFDSVENPLKTSSQAKHKRSVGNGFSEDKNKTIKGPQKKQSSMSMLPKNPSRATAKVIKLTARNEEISDQVFGRSKGKSFGAKPQTVDQPISQLEENDFDNYEDLIPIDDNKFAAKVDTIRKEYSSSPRLFHPSDLKTLPRTVHRRKKIEDLHASSLSPRTTALKFSSERIQRKELYDFVENEIDTDFSDILGKNQSQSNEEDINLTILNSKLSTNSQLDASDEELDPFAELEQEFDSMDLDANIVREKHARMCMQVETLINTLGHEDSEGSHVDTVRVLANYLDESPSLKASIVASRGILPWLELLDSCVRRDLILELLRLLNKLLMDDIALQENMCFVGGIPIITKFANRKYPNDVRLEAASFVHKMCESSPLILQMFVSCGGLNVLVEFLEEDIETHSHFVNIGISGVWCVFELQGSTLKNDLCRMFSRRSLLEPLSMALHHLLRGKERSASASVERIVAIFLRFSHSDNDVKEDIATRIVLRRLLNDLHLMSTAHQVVILKFFKNLSTLPSTLEVIQNSNAIEILTDILSTSRGSTQYIDISNQVLNTLYNLCRLSKARQEEAALSGLVPLLQNVVRADRPLKEFALPILYDFAHASSTCRQVLWQHEGLAFYLSFLCDPYWQVGALEAILIWLQFETATVEDYLISNISLKQLSQMIIETKANTIEGVLEPMYKLLRLAPQVALRITQPDFMQIIGERLRHRKTVVRLNLLRILKTICDAHNSRQILKEFALTAQIETLSQSDPAVLVKELARELIADQKKAEPRFRPDLHRSQTSESSYSTTRPENLQSLTSPDRGTQKIPIKKTFEFKALRE